MTQKLPLKTAVSASFFITSFFICSLANTLLVCPQNNQFAATCSWIVSELKVAFAVLFLLLAILLAGTLIVPSLRNGAAAGSARRCLPSLPTCLLMSLMLHAVTVSFVSFKRRVLWSQTGSFSDNLAAFAIYLSHGIASSFVVCLLLFLLHHVVQSLAARVYGRQRHAEASLIQDLGVVSNAEAEKVDLQQRV
ncbi:hypothetical protein B0H10DRAFT_1984133 [Mycena sp. CBHHK59/15]|nr:hypothetical protein B0H10DRAFT_1984133 [Mycena sp. CBHHK59/15]